MSDDVLVKVENVSKRFCRSLKLSLWYGLKDLGNELTGQRHGGGDRLPQGSSDIKLRQDEFWAVRGASFELKRGEGLGLVGVNGAGKTTLLKMLNGLIKPDTGRICMKGRVGAVIALGAGFNPLLSGRENIYINSSVLGISKKDVDNQIDEIIEFSEIKEFIDSPVQNYSSGMQVRLGFATATSLSPDILILDEVLAVGDANFRAKCYQRIDSIRKNTSLIFVSHSMDQVARLCNHAIFMDKGVSTYYHDCNQAIIRYETGRESEEAGFVRLNGPIKHFLATFDKQSYQSGSSATIEISLQSHINLEELSLRIVAYNSNGMHCGDSGSENLRCHQIIQLNSCTYLCSLKLDYIPFKRGIYYFSFNVLGPRGELHAWSHKKNKIEVQGGNMACHGDCQLTLSSTN